eukprot:6370486-Ditylum_brightwellii.AAC.1
MLPSGGTGMSCQAFCHIGPLGQVCAVEPVFQTTTYVGGFYQLYPTASCASCILAVPCILDPILYTALEYLHLFDLFLL